MESEQLNNKIWPNGTTYEIFVQSFADSNNDSIGDIPGMTAKLDYLKELGIQAIWLMPIHPSPSYHKYDVTDYFDIHPDYGTKEDFRIFVEEAHKRDIKIIMDFIVNHTSWEHPWFMESVKSSDNPYRDYYVWRDIQEVKDEISKKEVTLDSDNITQWHPWKDNDEYYYGFFYKGMPDLNFDSQKVHDEIIKIGRYWLEEYNVDGYRLDAARHIYPNERYLDCHAWWLEFGDAMRAIKPDIYLVGEVWGTAEEVGPYMTGLQSMFNFNLFYGLGRAIKEESASGLIDSLINSHRIYKGYSEDYNDAVFINNHDRNRIIDEVDGSIEKSRLAAAIVLTLPGMPYIYYGDEIGMLGHKPDEYIREPFLWDDENLAPEQTKWIEPRNSTYENVIPLSSQLNDESSTYAFFKYWIGKRNELDLLRSGELKKIDAPENIIAFRKAKNEKEIRVYHNLSGSTMTLILERDRDLKIIASINPLVSILGQELQLPPYSSVIME